jgi:hypothetical protein
MFFFLAEIMLRGLKMNHIEVKKALENMDVNALSDDYSVAVQKLLAIKNNLPTPEDVRRKKCEKKMNGNKIGEKNLCEKFINDFS